MHWSWFMEIWHLSYFVDYIKFKVSFWMQQERFNGNSLKVKHNSVFDDIFEAN